MAWEVTGGMIYVLWYDLRFQRFILAAVQKKKKDRRARTEAGRIVRRQLQESRRKTRRRQWHPTPLLLPGKSHGRRSLVGYSPWGREQSDTTERLPFHFSLSCTGEGNGNPLQCSCQENPRDGGAWWAAVYGVAQSRTRLMWLSSSSSRQKTMESQIRTATAEMLTSR